MAKPIHRQVTLDKIKIIDKRRAEGVPLKDACESVGLSLHWYKKVKRLANKKYPDKRSKIQNENEELPFNALSVTKTHFGQ